MKTQNAALAYSTPLGSAFCGDARSLLADLPDDSVNLVMTSPPFALQRKKEYGTISMLLCSDMGIGSDRHSAGH